VAAWIQPSYQICHNGICDVDKCTADAQCPPGYVCEKVCGYCEPIPGYCSANNMCDHWNGVCDIANNPYTTCAYCDLADNTCKPGCITNDNCGSGYQCNNHLCVEDTVCTDDAYCNAGLSGICDVENTPEYTTCFYCDGECKPGCVTTANCPSGYNCQAHHCEANQGKILINSITIRTESCTGCTTEGVIANLVGEKSPTFPTGISCTTNKLDRDGSTEFGAGGSANFDGTLNGSQNNVEEEMMKGCFHAALNNKLGKEDGTGGGYLIWQGDGTWTPVKTGGVCVDWLDDVYANECNLQNNGGQWELSFCYEITETRCN